jgi:hypothetical protein
MAILKSPPKPPKNETLQIRIEEELKAKLEQYAEFIDASEAYVVSEALKLIFHKDHEFKIWVERRPIINGQESKTVADSLFEVAEEASGPKNNQHVNAAHNAATAEKRFAALGITNRLRLS